jgi:DNA repair protein RadC
MTEFRYDQAIQHSLWTHWMDGTASTEQKPENLKNLRERMQRYGVVTLSTPELLLVALQPGRRELTMQIETLLASYSLQDLSNADFGQLCHDMQLGVAKAAQLQAMIEIARRLTMLPAEDKRFIHTARDAYEIVKPEMEYLDHEEVRIILLDKKHGVIANLKLYQGTMDSSVLRFSELFRSAVARKAASILLAHNHPSGDPNPSPEDEAITKQTVEAGKILEVDVVDHIIVGKNGRFVSLRERMGW